MVQLDLTSALIRHFLDEHWNLGKKSYFLELIVLECHYARKRVWHWDFRWEILHFNSHVTGCSKILNAKIPYIRSSKSTDWYHSHNTDVAFPISVVGLEIESQWRKQLLIVDMLLRAFDEAMLETGTENSAIHAYLIKKNYLVSKTMWNKFTEAVARDQTTQKAIKAVTVMGQGIIHNLYLQF